MWAVTLDARTTGENFVSEFASAPTVNIVAMLEEVRARCEQLLAEHRDDQQMQQRILSTFAATRQKLEQIPGTERMLAVLDRPLPGFEVTLVTATEPVLSPRERVRDALERMRAIVVATMQPAVPMAATVMRGTTRGSNTRVFGRASTPIAVISRRRGRDDAVRLEVATERIEPPLTDPAQRLIVILTDATGSVLATHDFGTRRGRLGSDLAVGSEMALDGDVQLVLAVSAE
jgi:hypothetical protein